MDIRTDVLIVGTGVAGMYAALNIKPDINVILITKNKSIECNSNLAQGGVSVALNNEDIDLFIQDTLKAGHYENNLSAVSVLAEESRSSIDMLIKLGVEFDRNDLGNLKYTREAAHSANRIVYCKDQTGKVITETLIKEVKTRKNIAVFEDTRLVDLLKKNNLCCGGATIKDRQIINVLSKVTILASGGIGGIFKNSTNYRSMTGDGIAIALKNNIKLKELNYVQIHPTSLYNFNPMERRFLISESVRGEGGRIINNKNERFIDELLPRDIVSQAIIQEEKRTTMPYVGLDISFMKSSFIKERFPGIYKECLEKGIDITRDVIPVTPAQHYFMGGIEVDLNSRTSMNNLYAGGEVSCTGVHGANRLASNSLLEALVFSKRASMHINDRIDSLSIVDPDIDISQDNMMMLPSYNKRIVIDEFNKVLGEMKDELVHY